MTKKAGRMLRTWAILIAPILVPASTTLAAQPPAQPAPGGINYVAVLSGTCESLRIRQSDATPRCLGAVINISERDGRSSFAFTEGDLSSVSFAGIGSPAAGDRSTLRVDRVTFTLLGAGTRPNVNPASGTCEFTNPYAGVSTIRCQARTSVGEFSATFRSNGQPPAVQPL